jgi:hypothetical protein
MARSRAPTAAWRQPRPHPLLFSRAQVKAPPVGGVEFLRLWREDNERPPRIRRRRTGYAAWWPDPSLEAGSTPVVARLGKPRVDSVSNGLLQRADTTVA